MDSHRDVDHESSAKRIKFDFNESNIGELCNEKVFSCFSTPVADSIDITEGISADCDSGYEASSTMESMPTPSHQTSPRVDTSESQEGSSESVSQTPTHIADQLDTSQDSLEMDDDDDNASTVSELSGLSDLSGQDWKPMAGSMIWIQQQMAKGINPREILADLGVEKDQIPEYVDDVAIWKIIIEMLAEPPRRNKLRHVNTLDDVVRLLRGAQNIIVLTGAGVSVSCGIPDFRSRDGIYSRLAIDFPNLPDPQAMFDISFFHQDPRPFFKFARDIYPGKFKPSLCHRFIKLLEKHNKLLRNYTQNIDTLEKVAGIESVIECHGSFATATCTRCSHKVTADKIRDIVLAQNIPLCEKCHAGIETSVPNNDSVSNGETKDFKALVASGIMKPDIVFFGEGLPDTFHEAMAEDKSKCDLLLVIGSSLKVRPVALIPSSLPANVPQILINREPLPHCHFDVELMGDCDVIINHLCQILGEKWEDGISTSQRLIQANTLLPLQETIPHIEVYNSKENLNQTEPNCTETETNCGFDEKHCCCRNSTKSSSSSLDNKLESNSCKCHVSVNKSINSNGSEEYVDIKSVKERHISTDSARDSGIGENSNFTDNLDENNDEKDLFHVENGRHPSSSENYTKGAHTSKKFSDLRGYWQPKVKKSLVDRLPDNSFHLVPPSRYIFPGAEVYYDPDEKLHYEADSSSSSSSDIDSDTESQSATMF